jgi:hypothetical protein
MLFTAGVSPQQTPAPHHIIVNRSTPRDEFTFDLSQVKASYLIGLGARYNLKQFFFTGEAQYNRREYVYNMAYTFPEFVRSETTQQMTESMNVINVPLSVGVDLGVVDVTSGFLPQFVISQKSDLSQVNGYSQKLDRVRLGMHTGLAVKIKDLRVGLSWQLDFNNYADHVYIKDQNLSLSGRSSRILGTMSYIF